MPDTFTSGVIILVNDTGTTGEADAALLTLPANVLATYAAAANSGDTGKLDVTATKKTAATIATALNITTSNAAALDNANTAVASGDATAYTAMNTVLSTGGTTAADASEQMLPDVGASKGSALAAVSGVNNVISSRCVSNC